MGVYTIEECRVDCEWLLMNASMTVRWLTSPDQEERDELLVTLEWDSTQVDIEA